MWCFRWNHSCDFEGICQCPRAGRGSGISSCLLQSKHSTIMLPTYTCNFCLRSSRACRASAHIESNALQLTHQARELELWCAETASCSALASFIADTKHWHPVQMASSGVKFPVVLEVIQHLSFCKPGFTPELVSSVCANVLWHCLQWGTGSLSKGIHDHTMVCEISVHCNIVTQSMV